MSCNKKIRKSTVTLRSSPTFVPQSMKSYPNLTSLITVSGVLKTSTKMQE
jgi:hypothetical protein